MGNCIYQQATNQATHCISNLNHNTSWGIPKIYQIKIEKGADCNSIMKITTHYPVTIIQPPHPQSIVTHSKFTKLKLLHFQQTPMGTCTPIQQYTDPPTHTTQTIFNFNASTASNIYHNIYPIKTTIIAPLYVLCIPQTYNLQNKLLEYTQIHPPLLRWFIITINDKYFLPIYQH